MSSKETKHLNKSEKNREHLERSKSEYVGFDLAKEGAEASYESMHARCNCGKYETWVNIPGETSPCPNCGRIMKVTLEGCKIVVTNFVKDYKQKDYKQKDYKQNDYTWPYAFVDYQYNKKHARKNADLRLLAERNKRKFEDSPHVNGLWVVAVAMAVFVLLVGIAYLTR